LREQQQEIEKTHHILEQSAITDVLTGLYNRRYLQEIFPKLLASAEREDLRLFAILLDLDYFKKINDTFGHIAGDECLIAFAEQLQQVSRASDHLFRLGGEEFLVLCVHNSISDAVSFAEKIRIKIEKSPVVFETHLIKMTVSGGISSLILEGTSEGILEDMLSQADTALYNAKHAGRNRIFIADSAADTAPQSPVLPTYRTQY
jgi:diguanylate cyclase (GGDEF)-like protein